MYNRFGASTDYKLFFQETDTLPSYVDARTKPYKYENPKKLDIFIRLNVNKLPFASKEYVGATIYHEILHAYLLTEGLWNPLVQHNYMAVNYANDLQAALIQTYPSLSSTDAKALAWGGLTMTNAWDSIRIDHYDESVDILVRNSYHRIATHGTKCKNR